MRATRDRLWSRHPEICGVDVVLVLLWLQVGHLLRLRRLKSSRAQGAPRRGRGLAHRDDLRSIGVAAHNATIPHDVGMDRLSGLVPEHRPVLHGSRLRSMLVRSLSAKLRCGHGPLSSWLRATGQSGEWGAGAGMSECQLRCRTHLVILSSPACSITCLHLQYQCISMPSTQSVYFGLNTHTRQLSS